MSDKDSTNREELLKIAGLVRPALASQPYIPALTHICFNGFLACAYNDIAAISVQCTLDVKRCIPGEMLIKTLGSFAGDNVLLQEGKGGALVISSGRNKVTLPTLGNDKFPLTWPSGAAPEIGLDDEIMKGIQRCLLSVGSDPTHPAQMGVTLDVDSKSNAVLFSTDNHTISRYQTATKIELPGDAPVILPTFFCEQLLRLQAAYPKAERALLMRAGSLVAEFGNDRATLFSKTLVDQVPLDFPKVINRMCDLAALREMTTEIPAGFDSALDRAMLVLSGEVDKATKIIPGDGVFSMHSSSSFGDADDRLKFDSKGEDTFFLIDPSHMARAAKSCSKMAFLTRALVMTDADHQFMHLIAHVSPPAAKKE